MLRLFACKHFEVHIYVNMVEEGRVLIGLERLCDRCTGFISEFFFVVLL